MRILGFFLTGALSQCPSYFRDNDVSTGCWTYDPIQQKCKITNPMCGGVTCNFDSMSRNRCHILHTLKLDIFIEKNLVREDANVKKIDIAKKLFSPGPVWSVGLGYDFLRNRPKTVQVWKVFRDSFRPGCQRLPNAHTIQ